MNQLLFDIIFCSQIFQLQFILEITLFNAYDE